MESGAASGTGPYFAMREDGPLNLASAATPSRDAESSGEGQQMGKGGDGGDPAVGQAPGTPAIATTQGGRAERVGESDVVKDSRSLRGSLYHFEFPDPCQNASTKTTP